MKSLNFRLPFALAVAAAMTLTAINVSANSLVLYDADPDNNPGTGSGISSPALGRWWMFIGVLSPNPVRKL